MAFLRPFLAIVGCLLFYCGNSQILINEICPANADIIYDTTFYEFNPWIELYNPGDNSVNLKGYFLSDDSQAREKWNVTEDIIIDAKGYLILWCDKGNKFRHTNFSLDTDGEQVILSDPSGNEIDRMIFPEQYLNVSYGRTSDGGSVVTYLSKATPGSANDADAVSSVLPDLVFSPKGGIFRAEQVVSISHPMADASIRYTLDGSEPNETSTVYSAPLVISSSTTVKAKAFRSGNIPSQTVVNSFIISDRDFSLPVVSLSLAPAYLSDNTIGIYVEGTNGVSGRGSNVPVNWNQNWYRHADFELFHFGKKVFDHAVDIRVYGNFSRTRPQKSFAIKARDKYGKSTLDFKFFPQKSFASVGGFTLRNSGTDWNVTHFKDALMHKLIIGQMDLDYSDYQPAALFLNGEYWGIQNFRERLEEDYFASNFSVSEDNLELMESNRTELIGTNTHYKNYRDSLFDEVDRKHPNTIRFIERNIDVQNFINYNVHNIYCGNTDWPGNNVKFWRRISDNGKFRWLLYDMDVAFGIEPENPTLEWATAPNSPHGSNRPSSTQHLRELLENPVFRNRFVQTMLTAIQTTYKPDRVIGIIDDVQNTLKAEMPYHRNKWGGSMNTWNEKVEYLRDFAVQRNPFMLQHTIDFFGLTDPIRVDVSMKPERGGQYKFNGVLSNRPLEDGIFFKGAMLNVEAIPANGYVFDHWTMRGRKSNNVTLIPYKSTWKYFDQGPIAATNWHLKAFNDASWSNGPGEFGYGDNDEGTVISYGGDRTDKYPTAYFRKTFSVNKANLQSMSGEIIFDDGVIVYLNGVEIFRRGMPLGPVTYGTFASQANENAVGAFVVEPGLLTDGENLLAVEVHQSTANSSDASFDLKLQSTETGDIETKTTLEPILADTAYSDVTLEANFIQVNGIVINEFSASNGTIRDGSNDADDWIELYNNSNTAVNLSNLFITDDLGNKKKYKIPPSGSGMIVQPGEYQILWADGQMDQGLNHIDLKLSDEGEAIGIYQMVNDKLVTVDEVVFTSQPLNYTWARIPNGTGPFVLTATPTFNAENVAVVGTVDETNEEIDVYPNPTQGTFHIVSAHAIQHVEIIDTIGRRIAAAPKLNGKVFDMSSFEKGIYLLRITYAGRSTTKRIVKN
jgi:hypothetical protein